MVSVIGGARTPWDLIGSQIGENISNVLPGAVQQGYNRGQLQESLKAIQQLAANPKSSPLDISLAAMQAGAGIPGSERYLATIIPELVKFAQSRREQEIRQPGEEGPIPIFQKENLPGFAQPQGQTRQLPGQTGQFFPTNIGSQNAPGNIPQAATAGQALPLLTPPQKRAEAKRLMSDSRKEGVPLTFAQALEEVNLAEQDKREHNKTVEEERKQRVGAQKTYGDKAAAELVKVFPNATSEQQAVFKKKGEEAAAQGKSEADIDRYLAKEATIFRNNMVNVEKDLSAPRLQNRIHRAFLGTDKDIEAASADMRAKLKPLLDLGLYDTARSLLDDKGYYPEEREEIINPMSERQKVALNKIPKRRVPGLETPGIGRIPKEEPIRIENIKSGLQDLKAADPNFSPVLARKAFEDKNYDWRSFKNAWNELLEEGFQLTDDQRTQSGYLDTPPLTTLQKILEGIKIIGR